MKYPIGTRIRCTECSGNYTGTVTGCDDISYQIQWDDDRHYSGHPAYFEREIEPLTLKKETIK